MITISFTVSGGEGELPPENWMVNRVRWVVDNVLKVARTVVAEEAPGAQLKRQTQTKIENTDKGAKGQLFIPIGLWYTLPPGTEPHFIPGGKAAGSRGVAAAIQLAKGYPLRFYWERVGHWVSLWSVDHPGYKPEVDWSEVVKDRVQLTVDEFVGTVGEQIRKQWTGK